MCSVGCTCVVYKHVHVLWSLLKSNCELKQNFLEPIPINMMIKIGKTPLDPSTIIVIFMSLLIYKIECGSPSTSKIVFPCCLEGLDDDISPHDATLARSMPVIGW